MSGNDSIDGLDGDDYVEGDAGNDLLSGGNGTDTLVGGAGDDTLDGGSGDDSLTGGVGNDAYFFSTGWGNDVIYDVDGNGTLRLPGYDAGLPAGQRLNSNQWSDANRKVFYTLVDGEQGKRDLIISFADRVDTVRVRDWAPARSFGIVLPDVPTSPPTTNTFTGDFHKKAGTSGLYAVGVDYNYVSDGAQPDAPDSIVGTTQADRMLGLGGNDLLMGLDGNDLLDGGAGDDLLLGGMGANTIFGGDGNDFIYGSGNGPWNFNAANRATPPAVTAAGPELARGFDWVAYNSLDMNVWSVAGIANPATVVSPEGDVLDGGAGNDHIVGGVGRDFIVGGTGNDFVYGLLGNDVISGGDGNDSLTGDGPAVVGLNLSMPANQNGNDLIDGGAGKDLLVGEGGNDTLNGGTDDDVLWGDGSYDGETPAQYSSSDILDGGDGNDWMSGGGGGDELRGGSGDDLMWGDYTQAAIDPAFHGADTLDGGDGNDTMMGAGGDDFLYGGAGNDAVWGDAPVSMLSLSANGNDFIDVGDGDDAVEGGGGSDTILGGMGVDTLSGNEGNDFIAGGSGDDKIYGNDGNDTLEGGGGTDYLEGGLGDDVYVIGRGDMPADATGKVETIVDGGGNDTVVLEGIGSHDIAGVVIGDSSLLLSIVGGDSVIADTAVERFSLSDRSTLGMAEMAGHYALTPGNVHLDNGRTGVLGGLRDDNIVYADSAGGGLTVSGGRGNDNINIGGSGNTYLFGRGDGSDVVADGALLADGSYGSRGASRIVFSEGISAADIRLAFNPAAFTTTCDTTPLFVQLAGTGDQIGISGFKGDITAPLSIDRLVFGDGSEVTLAQLIASNGFDIAGTDATDTLQGTAAVDHINGGGGDDHLVGGKGDDVLDGGAGNDSISPGEGNDRILFGRGDGKDDLSNDSIIGDGSRADVLEFKAGVAPSDVIVRTLLGGGSSGSSGVIELAIAGTNDSIAVRYKFGGDAAAFQECAIQQVKFADGTVWSSQDIAARLCQGAAGDDRLVGTKSGDSINGYAGADTVFAGAGDDTISGGSGNDTLSGEGGNDVYLFGRGDGNDVISQDYSTGSKLNVLQFKAGLLPADVTALRSGQDLLLQIAGSADSVLVSYFFLNDAPSNPYNPIQQIRFGDGTTWSLADIASRTYVDAATAGADTVHGTIGSDVIDGKAGADTLYGDDGNDTLIGGMGNDYLVGGRGNDVFTFNIGDGADNIDATDALSAVDTLRFGAGIAETDVRPMRSGNHLFFFVKGNADQVGVVNYFAAGTSVGGVSQDARIDRVEFASGAVWDQAMIQTMMDRVANNHAPTINTFLPTLNARADNAFSYVVPANTIVDADSWDSITYSIAMADGTAVPSWLHIDAATRTLYGTPPPSSVGPFQFVLWGTDVYGAKAGEYLNLSIEANRSPLLAAPLADLSAAQGAPLRYTVAASSFSDPDGGALRYAATLADGTPLPGWLVFDPATRTFSGTPATLGTTSVKVTASDAGNLSASDVFDIVVSVQNLSLSGSAASDTLTGGTGNDSVLGLGADDLLVGNAGNDTLDGGGGVDTMQGGAGDDIYVVDNASDVIVENAGEGVDKVNSSLSWTLGANVEQLTLTGSSAINGVGNTLDNRLVGNGAANSLTGGAGNDTVDGQGGADTLVGGAGDDVYVVDNAADVITEVAGEGTDRVFTWVNWTLGAELENLTLSGTAGLSGTGNALNNYLIGNSAANMLSGGAGNDTLDGVAGADTLVGGTGDDAYVVDNVADVIVENAGEGTDRVVSSVNWTLGADLENLTLSGTAGLSGTGNALNNYLIGNSAANTLTGGGGNDTLDGLTGTDTMIGGSGDDVYYVDTALDVIVENVGEGLDKVNSSLSWTLGANVEQLTLTGSSAINGVGNTLDNRLVGNGAANSLTGGAGNDTVDGQGGADTLVGGAGDDVYVVDNAADVITEVAGEGTDRVFTWVNWTLGAELENLTLSGAAGLSGTGNALNNSLIGNSAANVLSGGAGNDTLDGQAGADTLIGGTGDDAYVVDNVADVITENVGEGIDRVVSSVSWTLGSAIENLTLTGTSGLSGTGNALNNYLIGNSAANTLTGGAGNDILDGQAGADTLVGGLGDDGYIVDNASDVIAENVGEGIDRVSSALSWTLGANVENLTLSGAGSINGTGNSLSNWLTGNAGSNVLSGLDGNDRIDGGAGNDTLIGGLGSDVYMFGKTYGVDTVQENDASAGVKDRVEFGTGIATGDTSFVRSGNDLQVLIAGTADKLVLQNWYLGNSYHVEEFAYKDGTVLTDAQVQGLVSAMAAFAAPASVDSRSSDFFDGRRQRGDQVLAANAIA